MQELQDYYDRIDALGWEEAKSQDTLWYLVLIATKLTKRSCQISWMTKIKRRFRME